MTNRIVTTYLMQIKAKALMRYYANNKFDAWIGMLNIAGTKR